jgi:hypothetical protein
MRRAGIFRIGIGNSSGALAPLFFGRKAKALIARQLQRIIVGVALVSAALIAGAQVEVFGPLHITHVEGYVFDTHGKPVANAAITLERDGRVAASTQTDGAGVFKFEKASGDYLFRVARTNFAPAVRDLVVTDEVVTHLERKKLYVVVGPGACMDACSSVLTNKKEFQQLIKRDNGNRP